MDTIHGACATVRRIRRTLLAVELLSVTSAAAGAQSASQVVRFRVIAQTRAEVAPVSGPVSLRSATAGMSTSALALATNDPNLKVVASLDRPLPAGASLSLALGDRAMAANSGGLPLGTTTTDVITRLAPTDGSRIPVAYRISAGGRQGTPAGEQHLVTYTILAAP